MEHQFTFSDLKLPSVKTVFVAVTTVPVMIGRFTLERSKHHLAEYQENHQKGNLIFGVLYEMITLLCIAPLLTIVFDAVMSLEDFDLKEKDWEGIMIISIFLLFLPVLMEIIGFVILKRAEHHFEQYKNTKETGDFILCILWEVLTSVCFMPLTIFLVFHLKESFL